jgi:glutamate synthase domain-containing protein 3
MRTGRDVAIAAILGAEEYGFCTAALIVMGCVMLRHCHLNNCSVGVATQDDILQERFSGKVEHVINYFNFVGNHLREVMASLGVCTIDGLIGRTDLLEINTAIIPWKAKNIDLSKILYQPKVQDRDSVYCTRNQDHKINDVLDRKLIGEVIPAIQKDKNIEIIKTIANTDRTTGAMLSGEICRLFGDNRLCEDTVKVKFSGTAGQSFGAFLAKGITFELAGLANDYVGKGISGGKIIIYPGKGAQYVPEENIIIGNTTFYGAIAGQAYIRGLAGERFCIRNSGLYGVVEGVGDHGCEYMTGGRIVILGKTGRNFGAGMSGGVAYVYDLDGKFKERCNMAMVELGTLEEEDKEIVHNLVSNHYKYTQSMTAKKFLDDFTAETKRFVRVMPLEYKRIMEEKKNEQKLKTTVVSDG